MLVFTTRSPTSTSVTASPLSTTTPANSCPITVPFSKPGVCPCSGKRSAPQIAAALTRTIASVGSSMRASGTSSTRTSPGAASTTAFTPAPLPSVVRHPAVGDEQLPGHPAGLLGGKERDRRRDVDRLAPARDALQHLDELERLRVLAGHHALGRSQAGRDRVDRDPVRPELAGQRPREGVDAALRGDVVRQARCPRESHIRG